jgi:hypothetical protein
VQATPGDRLEGRPGARMQTHGAGRMRERR